VQDEGFRVGAKGHDKDYDIEQMIVLWERERQAELVRFREERDALPFKERLRRGLALSHLIIEETRPSSGGRVNICVGTTRTDVIFDRQHVRVRPGDPVVLFRESADEPDAIRAIAGRWSGSLLQLAVGVADLDFLGEKPFRLEREAPGTTFERGAEALRGLRSPRGDVAATLKFVRGLAEPERARTKIDAFFDMSLDAAQQEAITNALAVGPISLIHGPPGTGKTRCLVEVIRQAVARGDRVLFVAPSNTAVDNLTERLIAAEVDPLRIGHPARVDPAVEEATLDTRLDATDASRLAAGWIKEAHGIRHRAEKQVARGTGDRLAHRDAFREARRLLADARDHLRRAERVIIDRAPVICVTLVLAGHPTLRDTRFDLVVVDEATQAIDPLAWIALTRAPRAILAGDPKQLSPTIIDPEVARSGLATPIFERLHALHGDTLLRMLITQHRMHESLMAFPSAAMYEGRLVAHSAVAGHRLEQLEGVGPDSLRSLPFVFVDAAGAGWFEEKREPDGSTFNREMARRTAIEVRRLLARGVSPTDIGVITPYDAQASILRQELAGAVQTGLEVSSIDGFQGREKEAIVVDLVRSNDGGEIGFLADTRRINVALTRARRALVVVGDSATIGGHPFYADFLEHVEAYGAWLNVFSDDGLGEM